MPKVFVIFLSSIKKKMLLVTKCYACWKTKQTINLELMISKSKKQWEGATFSTPTLKKYKS